MRNDFLSKKKQRNKGKRLIEELKKYNKPKYNIRIKLNERHLWSEFHEYHYMTADKDIDKGMPSGAMFYTAYIYEDGKETLFGCLGVIPQISKIPARRITRFTLLPAFQGLGLASAFIEVISQYYYDKDIRMYCATFHPRLGEFMKNSDDWAASHHNLVKHKPLKEFFDENQWISGQRDGVAMYRYSYQPQHQHKYKLLYDPLELNALKREQRKDPTPEKKAKIRELERKIDSIQKREQYKDEIFMSDVESKKTKEKLKVLFNKPKRVPLTAAERKKIKEQKNARN